MSDKLMDELAATVADLQKRLARYEAIPSKCGNGHENHLPLSLWNCPTCTDKTEKDLRLLIYHATARDHNNPVICDLCRQINEQLRIYGKH